MPQVCRSPRMSSSEVLSRRLRSFHSATRWSITLARALKPRTVSSPRVSKAVRSACNCAERVCSASPSRLISMRRFSAAAPKSLASLNSATRFCQPSTSAWKLLVLALSSSMAGLTPPKVSRSAFNAACTCVKVARSLSMASREASSSVRRADKLSRCLKQARSSSRVSNLLETLALPSDDVELASGADAAVGVFVTGLAAGLATGLAGAVCAKTLATGSVKPVVRPKTMASTAVCRFASIEFMFFSSM